MNATETQSGSSLQPDGWAAVELPNMQKKKLLFLLERGAKVKSAKLLIQAPNGLCTLDDFGRVEWIKSQQPNDQGDGRRDGCPNSPPS